ncbi:MAG: 3'-5' exonuclease [Erysipelotrichia bacterium]|nr:3'-5' exonuclease [Erysipelotrichia bacterium]
MKSNRRITPKPSFKLQNIIQRLKNEAILYTEFLELLEKATDSMYENSELEFELLLSNGLPLEFDGDFVFLKTKNTLIEDQTFCIVDIETNGGSVKKGFQIIELGAVKYKNGHIIDKFESLVYAKDIPPYVQEVTKITPKMLEDAPRLENVLKKFKIFLDDDVFIAHDIKFDYTFISESFEKYNLGKLLNRKICSIDLARRTIEAERYGLSSLKEILNINVEHHHRAYYDALTTAIVFEKSLQNLDINKIKTVEDLITFSKSDNVINSNPKKS